MSRASVCVDAVKRNYKLFVQSNNHRHWVD